MRLLNCLVLLLLPAALSLADAPPKPPAKGVNEIFVGALSYWADPGQGEKPSPMGDEKAGRKANQAELDLKGYLGQMPGLDYLIQPETPPDLFLKLAHLTQGGKRVRYLVIAGHGSGDLPHITFSKANLTAADVDVDFFQKRLQSSLKLNQEENNLYDRVDVDLAEARIPSAHQVRSECRPRLKEINDAADGMAPGAVILLLNCSAGRTAQAQEMSRWCCSRTRATFWH